MPAAVTTSQLFITVIVCYISLCLSQPTMEENADGRGGKLTFKPPPLSDEDSHSAFMPDYLMCDACWAIEFHLSKQFKKAAERFKSRGGVLPESEVLEVFEKVCSSKTFENYGLKEVKGVKRLSGDGIPDPVKNAPGMMQGGGKWPGRMLDMCDTYIDKYGEMKLYEEYRNNMKKKHGFRKYLCSGDEHPRDPCTKAKKKKDEL